jgi:hypothetical protein
MKFTLTLPDGRWIGGFMARRDNLAEMLRDLRGAATEWGQTITATRTDKVGRGETYAIKPRRT